jgi:hypothetical protein
MVPEGGSDDWSRGYDDSITMLYIDGDRLIFVNTTVHRNLYRISLP